MNELSREDYINYRINLSWETLHAAEVLMENKMWNSAVNRLYYSCFYMVTALLVKYEIQAKTHSGVKSKFLNEFVKIGTIDIESGKLYNNLLDWRQKGDYGDFEDFSQLEVEMMVEPVRNLLLTIEAIIKKD